MRSFSLHAIAAFIGGLAITVAAYVAPHQRSESISPSSDRAAVASAESDVAMTESLEARIAATQRRYKGKLKTTFRLIRREITLLQAAARFRDLNKVRPEIDWKIFRDTNPGANDDERHCRQVMRWVENATQFQPKGGKLVADLYAELNDRLEKDTLRLPRGDEVAAK